jgi:hypothetical protein
VASSTPDKHHNQGPLFRGNIAVQKLLLSAGLRATKIGLYRNRLGSIWEVETDSGKRWVSHTEKYHWKISKTPPGAPTKEPTCVLSE